MRKVGRLQMQQVEMARPLLEVEHGDRAVGTVDHEGGVVIIGRGRHQAGDKNGQFGRIILSGASGVGYSHRLSACMLRYFSRSVHMSPDDHAYAPAARARNEEAGVAVVPSVCPHDCTSTCALEVERLSPTRIGRVPHS